MSRKIDLGGEVFMVLVDGEYAGWFNIPEGNSSTEILRSALSSNPTIINFTELPIDITDLPAQADGWNWNGNGFDKN